MNLSKFSPSLQASSRWLPFLGVALLALVIASPATASVCPAPEIFGPIVNPHVEGTVIFWEPQISYELLTLRVSAPCGDIIRTFKEGEMPFFDVREVTREVDGRYAWELTARPRVDPAVQDQLAEVRGTPEEEMVVLELWDKGMLPRGPFNQAGSFRVVNGLIADPDEVEKGAGARSVISDGGLSARFPSSGGDGVQAAGNSSIRNISAADFVIIDDLIVDGSACIGFDCVNGESFGFDTIRLKENNLRIKFDDTSTAASFPRNDWQITANDSANGGLSKFSIDDISGSRTPFTIEANAPSHSLYVDDGGRIGNGTSTPSVEIHTVDGDTPTLRLQQDGSSGFAPQTWDVAGNETSFFIRDVTSGSTLPFRIRPDADSNSLVIDSNNNVGIGTLSPEGDGLEVERTGSVTQRILLRLQNAGAPQSELANSDSGITWRFGQNNSGDFVINDTADLATAEFRVTTAGTVFVNGGQVHPDYVFDTDYDLMSLTDLEQFIEENGHLPRVQTAEDRKREGGVNITELPLQLLEKVEELTLYTIQQQKQIDELTELLNKERQESLR